MKVIRKYSRMFVDTSYTAGTRVKIHIPKGSLLTHASSGRDGAVDLWYLVDNTEAVCEDRRLQLCVRGADVKTLPGERWDRVINWRHNGFPVSLYELGDDEAVEAPRPSGMAEAYLREQFLEYAEMDGEQFSAAIVAAYRRLVADAAAFRRERDGALQKAERLEKELRDAWDTLEEVKKTADDAMLCISDLMKGMD